ncbi:MAG: hypothetical protein WCR52_12425 [Bacteroidota bacterium]
MIAWFYALKFVFQHNDWMDDLYLGFLLEFYADLKKIILFRFDVNVAACEGGDTDDTAFGHRFIGASYQVICVACICVICVRLPYARG